MRTDRPGRSLRALRREIMQSNGWSLRDLYRTLETPSANRLRDAHATLDTAVRAAGLVTAQSGLRIPEIAGLPSREPGPLLAA